MNITIGANILFTLYGLYLLLIKGDITNGLLAIICGELIEVNFNLIK